MIRMGVVRFGGRILAGALAFVISLGGCGGQSEFASDDDARAGETKGGTGSGGASPLGGTFGTGGSGSITGTGGTPSCTECPSADYGLVIEGDGAPYEMHYNGFIEPEADPPSPFCSDEPLRGAVGGCGRGIVLWACEDPMSGPPCLEVNGAMLRYVDRQRGELFSGRLTSDVPGPSDAHVESGTLTATLTNATGDTLVLTVSYTFCAELLTNTKIVC